MRKKGVVLYGAGGHAAQNIDSWSKEFEILCFVDADKNKHFKKIAGYKILPPSEAFKLYPNCDVVISLNPKIFLENKVQIFDTLLSSGVDTKRVYSPDGYINGHDYSSASNDGYCTVCESETSFLEMGLWLRDFYLCSKCRSIPRQRALISALNTFVPKWREQMVHESSPSMSEQISSLFLESCKQYSYSYYFDGVPSGTIKDGARSENLESMTFDNEVFDLFITQDVFEHVMRPEKGFSEIARVLKKGGMHIFTMPWYPSQSTHQRAKIENGSVVYLDEPVWHGSPVDFHGSLVTFDWGVDFCDFIYKSSGMTTTVYLHKDRNLGLDGEFLHVFVSKKL